IRRDQRLAGFGIVVAATQLVLLCWFALFLAVRHTADERRPDIGLLKLRGAASWRIWSLTAQQSALPMLTGAVLGWLLRDAAAAVLAGGPPSPTAEALRLSIVVSIAVCVGAFAAAVGAEWSTLRAPVAGLLRRVPARTRPVVARLVDLTVVAVAVAGVYQGR